MVKKKKRGRKSTTPENYQLDVESRLSILETEVKYIIAIIGAVAGALLLIGVYQLYRYFLPLGL